MTPVGGIALDLSIGSGSTGKAAMREGSTFIGCEMDKTYMEIARPRIQHETAAFQLRKRAKEVNDQQLSLFLQTSDN